MPTVREFAAAWLVRITSRMRETSSAAYADHLRLYVLPRFGDVALDGVRRRDVTEAAADWLRTRRACSVSMTLTVLRQLYYDAIDAELLQVNPAARFGRHVGRQQTTRGPIPASAFVTALVALLGRQPRAAWILLLQQQTGLRLGEVLGLRWEDVDDDTLRVRRQWYSRLRREAATTKDGRPRAVPLTPTARAVLARWDRRTVYVHENPATGRPYAHNYVQRWWRWTRERSGLPTSYVPHGLRHAYGTQLIEAGISERTVQQLLGHRDPRQTQRYTRQAVPPVPIGYAEALRLRHPPLRVVPSPTRRARRTG